MNKKMREIMVTSWVEWHDLPSDIIPEVNLSYEHGFNAACNALIPLLKQSYPHVYCSAGAEHMLQGFRPSRLPIDTIVDAINEVID